MRRLSLLRMMFVQRRWKMRRMRGSSKDVGTRRWKRQEQEDRAGGQGFGRATQRQIAADKAARKAGKKRKDGPADEDDEEELQLLKKSVKETKKMKVLLKESNVEARYQNDLQAWTAQRDNLKLEFEIAPTPEEKENARATLMAFMRKTPKRLPLSFDSDSDDADDHE